MPPYNLHSFNARGPIGLKPTAFSFNFSFYLFTEHQFIPARMYIFLELFTWEKMRLSLRERKPEAISQTEDRIASSFHSSQ
jgi:hypothetical protein